MNDEMKTALWDDLSCPHCEEQIFGLFVAELDDAALVLARSEEHLTEILNSQVRGPMTEDGVRRRRSTRKGEGDGSG